MKFNEVTNKLITANALEVCIETPFMSANFEMIVDDVINMNDGVLIKGDFELNLRDSASVFYNEDFGTYVFNYQNERIEINIK